LWSANLELQILRTGSAPPSRKLIYRLSGIDAAAGAELDEFRYVQPAASRFGPGDPPLALLDLRGKFPLRQVRLLSNAAEEWRDLAVNQGLIALCRHQAELSAADSLKRFAHTFLDALSAIVDNAPTQGRSREMRQ
jgi:hypothetical protein